MDTGVPTEQGGIDWKRALPRLAVVLLGIIVFVLLLVWLISALKGDNNKPISSGAESSQKAPSNSQPAQQPAKSSSSAPASSSAPSTNSTGGTPATPAQTGGNLANTGPGGTLAIFAVASGAGIIGYQTYLRRRSLQ